MEHEQGGTLFRFRAVAVCFCRVNKYSQADAKPAFAEFPLLGMVYRGHPQPGAGKCFVGLAPLWSCKSTTGGVVGASHKDKDFKMRRA